MKKVFGVLAMVAMLSVAQVTPVFASADENLVADDLFIYYDGVNNANGSHDAEATVWKDLAGGAFDYELADGKNVWTDKGLKVSGSVGYVPQQFLTAVNESEYTLELVLGEIETFAPEYTSLLISDNDEFSLFIRSESKVLEYKYNDKNQDRPVAEGGDELANNSTVTLTFDGETASCKMYIDGELVDDAVPTEGYNVADNLSLGSNEERRAWEGEVYAMRVYKRALSAEEVAQNAKVDDMRYRSDSVPTIDVPLDFGSDEQQSEKGLSDAEKIAIAVSAVSVVVIVASLGYVAVNKRKMK